MQESGKGEVQSGEMERINKALEKKFSDVMDNEIMQRLLEMVKKHRFARLSDSSNREEKENDKG